MLDFLSVYSTCRNFPSPVPIILINKIVEELDFLLERSRVYYSVEWSVDFPTLKKVTVLKWDQHKHYLNTDHEIAIKCAKDNGF